jgi:ADP-ribose pyrophosphatase YjhB (NUDIX family)
LHITTNNVIQAPARLRSMPLVRVELVLLSPVEGALSVLLGRRTESPFKGRWALPDGVLRIDLDDDLACAARRVSRERLDADVPCLEQVRAVGGPRRDPRAKWALSVVYRGLVRPGDVTPRRRPHALQWRRVDALAGAALAFDHGELIDDAARALRDEVARLELPFAFLPERFTLTELQARCEELLGHRLDKSSFRRRLEDRNLVDPVAGETRTGANRPAQVYRRRQARP